MHFHVLVLAFLAALLVTTSSATERPSPLVVSTSALAIVPEAHRRRLEWSTCAKEVGEMEHENPQLQRAVHAYLRAKLLRDDSACMNNSEGCTMDDSNVPHHNDVENECKLAGGIPNHITIKVTCTDSWHLNMLDDIVCLSYQCSESDARELNEFALELIVGLLEMKHDSCEGELDVSSSSSPPPPPPPRDSEVQDTTSTSIKTTADVADAGNGVQGDTHNAIGRKADLANVQNSQYQRSFFHTFLPFLAIAVVVGGFVVMQFRNRNDYTPLPTTNENNGHASHDYGAVGA